MHSINRTAILILARQPFLDWLHQTDPSFPITLVQLNEDANIYLIPESDNPEHPQEWLRRHFDTIFSGELESWYPEESLWPAHRTFTLFEKWFSWTAHSLVYDLAKDSLRHDDF